MNFKSISFAVRILIAAGLGYFLLRFLLGDSIGGDIDPSTKLIGLMLFILYGGVLFALFGIPLLRRAGEKAAAFYMPSDDNFRIMPEYSLAEARLKEGKYEEAIAGYWVVIEEFPNDVYAHVQIARIASEFLKDQRLAEAELLTAAAKAVSEDSLLLAYNRLADHYHIRLKNTHRAIDVLNQLKEKVGPAAVHRVQERLIALHAAAQKTVPDDAPSKITFRQADDESLRKRRGY